RSRPSSVFSFHPTATPVFYPLSLHDALPIYKHRFSTVPLRTCKTRRVSYSSQSNTQKQQASKVGRNYVSLPRGSGSAIRKAFQRDRKSTRLNSSHVKISYAVFCLKKKKQTQT